MRQDDNNTIRIETPEVPKCDFCSSRPIAWRYPCRDINPVPAVSVPGVLDQASIGDWAACQACYDLIEAGRWDDLARRTLAGMSLPVSAQAMVLRLARRMHQSFQAARTGAPIKV